MAVTFSIFSPQVTEKVTLGGQEYTVQECRACDLPELAVFIESLNAKTIKDIVTVKLTNKELDFDYRQIVNIVKKQPESLCTLLAAIFDLAPFGNSSSQWRKDKIKEFMVLPISELTRAFGLWLEVNASFFGAQVAPILIGATAILAQVEKQIEQQLTLMNSSPIGNG
jgi:hypothetical protein